MVFAFLRGGIGPKSSAVRSAAVADCLGLVVELDSGATDTLLLTRDGDSLFCFVRDRAALKLRVATRLVMVEDRGQEVKLATGASHSFET